MKIKYIAIIILFFAHFNCINAQKIINPYNKKEWKLVWKDDFNYKTRDKLLKTWIAQNGTNNHILCSRWEDNIELGNGTVKLVNKKEKRGGQDWTSASMWTRMKFKYGYYECRYKYASASATNNSFWLMTAHGDNPTEGKRFEIDINEGHYPNSVNTNIHNWSDITTTTDGRQIHPSAAKSLSDGVNPAYTFQLEIPVKTSKIRFSSNHSGRIHIGEFRIYEVNSNGYPEPFENNVNKIPNLINLTQNLHTKISCSGVYQDNDKFGVLNVIDGDNQVKWISQDSGEKWIEFQFDKQQTIGCIQFTNGWGQAPSWSNLLSDFKIECWDDNKWIQIGLLKNDLKLGDLSKEFHTYGLEWNEKEIIFYFDRKEIRREKNYFCFSPTPIWLSLAIIPWHGQVTNAIDGTKMEIDYVRVFKQKVK